MSKIVYRTATTLPGHIADEHQSLDRLFAVEDGAAPPFEEFPASVGVLVQGFTTYEWVLRHESLLEEPKKWQVFYGGRPTYVFTSRTLPAPAGADVRSFVATFSMRCRACAPPQATGCVGGRRWIPRRSVRRRGRS